MNLILLTKRRGRPVTIELGHAGPMALMALVALSVVLLVFAAGAGWQSWRATADASMLSTQLHAELERQQAEVDEARRAAREGVDALAIRLGRAHAHILRLDALGQRLTRMAEIDPAEFDFDQHPALGGPEDVLTDAEPLGATDFLVALETLADQLDRREQQLVVLENLMMSRNLQRQVLPAGRPTEGGWISSQFGMRNDPFSGQRAHHGGIDIAGRDGSPIVAVAAGVVTWSGDRFGYGRMVEINHGNGYTTRYAHNRENLVQVGEAVRKGQHIAVMGMTGRATAPHVHFEVLQNGRVVNPLQYIHAAN
jgi:murein DD-endopeptidase MepM/ murein hydrolase activator NlpD